MDCGARRGDARRRLREHRRQPEAQAGRPDGICGQVQRAAWHRVPAAGQLSLAKEKLERSLKQNPRDPDVHTSLGLLYDRTGDSKLADKHFREALRLAPDKPDLSNNYAIYLCKNGRVDEGVELFSSVAANKFYRTPEVALTNAGVFFGSDGYCRLPATTAGTDFWMSSGSPRWFR